MTLYSLILLDTSPLPRCPVLPLPSLLILPASVLRLASNHSLPFLPPSSLPTSSFPPSFSPLIECRACVPHLPPLRPLPPFPSPAPSSCPAFLPPLPLLRSSLPSLLSRIYHHLLMVRRGDDDGDRPGPICEEAKVPQVITSIRKMIKSLLVLKSNYKYNVYNNTITYNIYFIHLSEVLLVAVTWTTMNNNWIDVAS